jgi:GNAT superfamily N-acetyltransferase
MCLKPRAGRAQKGLTAMDVRPEEIDLEFFPLTEDRWPDFEALFGERGAVGGCWCMWWRLKRSEYERLKGVGNRQAMKAIVESGEVPGLLAYEGDTPVAWCSVAPREQFPVLQRSRNLKPVDDTPVWSIVCFFVRQGYRDQGLASQLIQAAVEYVRTQGGNVVEAYPVEPSKGRMPTVFAFTGFASTFEKAGFVECLRRSETRPIMRYYI